MVEDHYPEGGLGAAVLEALAGADVPLSCASPTWPCRACPARGPPAELLDAAGISASHIVEAARALVG